MARKGGRDEEENSHRASMLSSTSSRRSVMTDPYLLVCKCFSFFVSLAAILCILVLGKLETECRFILRFWRVLEYWAGGGMLQILVVVTTRAFPDVNGARKDLVLLQEGVLCIGFLKRARQSKEVTRIQAVKDLKELERRKGELEALLSLERA
ncbi:hypothetical protein MKX03_000681 [Papaver bracteatum]|nr:hypothetical protein MKX03_000681 [Papaver bracteatum]